MRNGMTERPFIYQGKVWDKYTITATGEVYSYKRNRRVKMNIHKKQNNTGRGDYPAVSLTSPDKRRADGTFKTQLIPLHIALAESFLIDTLPLPLGITETAWRRTPRVVKEFLRKRRNMYEVNHINHDKYDYSLENLEWVTSEENTQKSADYYKNK